MNWIDSLKRYSITSVFVVLMSTSFSIAQEGNVQNMISRLIEFDQTIAIDSIDIFEKTVSKVPNALQAEYYVALANYYIVVGREYSLAATNYHKALQYNDISLYTKADAFNGMGAMYTYLSKNDLAIEKFKEALNIFKENFPDSIGDISSLYNNIGHVYAIEWIYDSSDYYFDKGIKYSQSFGEECFSCLFNRGSYHWDIDSSYYYTNLAYKVAVSQSSSFYETFCLLNLGAQQRKRNRYISADTLLEHARISAIENNQTPYLSEIMLQKGILKIAQGEVQKGIDIIKDVIPDFEERQDYNQLTDAYSWLDIAYKTNGNFEDAYIAYNAKQTADSTLKANAKIQLEQANEALDEYYEWLETERARNSKLKKFFFAIITLGGLLFMAFAAFIYYRRKQKKKLELINALNSKLKANLTSLKDQRKLSEEQLINNGLLMKEKQSEMEKLSIELSEISENLSNDNDKEKLRQLNETLQYNIGANLNQEFEIHFNQIHPNFVKRLLEINDKLTKNEIRLASLIKLDFSTKEIKSITKQNSNTINVAKTRLKKNLNIKLEDDLYAFLQNLNN